MIYQLDFEVRGSHKAGLQPGAGRFRDGVKNLKRQEGICDQDWRYFENAFDDGRSARKELRSFAEDHFGKLRTAGTLAATEAVFGPFDAALSDRAEQIGSLGGIR
ncbi:MAG TPA: hypothetical protein VIT91_00260 [Chthoniobacterales bacterium]